MFELMLCSMFTLVPDYLYRRYGQGKRIGKGLEADLEIAASGDLLGLLRRHAAGLKEFLNVSRVLVIESKEPNVVLEVAAVPAAGS